MAKERFINLKLPVRQINPLYRVGQPNFEQGLPAFVKKKYILAKLIYKTIFSRVVDVGFHLTERPV
jgi:hypothetical protein